MSILWSDVIVDEFRQNANLALSAYHLEPGQIDDLARFYGVGRRTCERWFAADGQQRRPCMTREVNGKRLLLMSGSVRLEYLRKRCFLPCLFAVDGGIEREIDLDPEEYDTKVTTFPRPSLELALKTAFDIPSGLETRWLQVMWLRMVILDIGPPKNPFLLVVTYAAPKKYEDKKGLLDDEGDPPPTEEDGEGEYDEYDGEPFQWVWEPE